MLPSPILENQAPLAPTLQFIIFILTMDTSWEK
jgi:hypothetical protein